jgi:hypothetical protein
MTRELDSIIANHSARGAEIVARCVSAAQFTTAPFSTPVLLDIEGTGHLGFMSTEM